MIIKKSSLFIIVLYILSSITYIFSLKKVSGTNLECFSKYGLNCYFFLGKLLFLSAFLTDISIYLIIFKNYSKIHLLIIFLIYCILFLIDHNSGIIYHGFYNIITFLFFLIFISFIFYYLQYLLFLHKQKKHFLLFKLIIPFFFLYITMAISKIKFFSCKNWSKGFNGTIIDNVSKDFPCQINIPKPHSCYLKEISHYLDFTAKYQPNCSDDKVLKIEQQILFKNFRLLKFSNESKLNHFGLPITNQKNNGDIFGTILTNKGKKNFFNYINENIILMDLYNKNKSKYYPNINRPEIEVFFKNETGKIIINVKKKKDLIKKREKITNNNKFILYKNILIFFFDTLSRAHFHRKFHKTGHFLSQFSAYETNFTKKNLTIFEYFKYHSLITHTDPNIKAAYYGTKINKKGIHFANYFKKNGYIIGRTNTYCEKECVYNNNKNKLFIHSNWDHEGLSIPCLKGVYHGILCGRMTSWIKKCLFGKDIFQYSLEYLESFWTNYIKQNKMFLFQSLDGHEPTGEVIGYLDEVFYHFVNNFYSNGFLKDTVVIIFADHGQHLFAPLYFTKSMDFLYERTLPILILIVPNERRLYQNNLYETLKNNQQVFITPYDIHETLINLAFGKDNNNYKKFSTVYGNSLFKELNYKIRFCESPLYDSQIKICNCKKRNEFSLKSNIF